MIIQIDENNNVISLITVGGLPEGDPSYIRLNKYDVPTEILEHITDYIRPNKRAQLSEKSQKYCFG